MKQQVSKALILVMSLALAWTVGGKIIDVTGRVPRETGMMAAYRVERIKPAWHAALMLLSPLQLTVNCSTTMYEVVTAESVKGLATKSATKVWWCGWKNIGDHRVCVVEFSPCHVTVLGVKALRSAPHSNGQSRLVCSVSAKSVDFFVLTRHSMAVAAAVLFIVRAGFMNTSPWFRCASGAMLGVMGLPAGLLLLAMAARWRKPAGAGVSVVFALSATAMAGIGCLVCIGWGPGIQQVLLSRVGAWYILLTGAAGVAVTYWLDDPANASEAVCGSLRLGLQGTGVALLIVNLADRRISYGIVVVLLAATAKTTNWMWADIRHVCQVVGAWLLQLHWLARLTNYLGIVTPHTGTRLNSSEPTSRSDDPDSNFQELSSDFTESTLPSDKEETETTEPDLDMGLTESEGGSEGVQEEPSDDPHASPSMKDVAGSTAVAQHS